MSRDPFPYEDIIDLPHPVSRKHKPMDRTDRAAQFAPFAALTGYGDVIEETARLTDRRIELSESEQAELNDKLGALARRLPAEATLTWFVPDGRKDGGRYESKTLTVRRIQPGEGRLVLADGGSIGFDCLLDVEFPEKNGNY